MAKSAEKDARQSLWLKLLHGNAKKSAAPNITNIILGSNSILRKQLVNLLGQNDQMETGLDNVELVHYSHFDIEDPSFDTPQKLNIWAFDEKIISSAAELINLGKTPQRVSY
jgi:hypothetical protein